MNSEAPARYDANDVEPLLRTLPTLVEAECRRRGISQREASRQLGLSAPTITRVIQGHGADARSTLRILRWLDLDSAWLRVPDSAAAAYRRGWDDCATHIRAALAGGRDPAPL